MCLLALLGIIFMIIENELSFKNIHHQQLMISLFIKTMISITTIVLVMLVFYYNRLNLEMYALTNSLGSWRVGLTRKKMVVILLEIFVCSIHPFPRYQTSNHLTPTHPLGLSYIETDVALGLPSTFRSSFLSKTHSIGIDLVFARIYLLCRFLMFHSNSVRNTSSQSLGYLNEVPVNFLSLLKTYLEQWPTGTLSVYSITLFLVSSWSFRACNYDANFEHFSMGDSLWLLVVTFTTVGR